MPEHLNLNHNEEVTPAAVEQADPHADTKRMDHVLQRGNVNDLEQLLESGIDINQTDWEGRTALMMMAVKGDVDAVDLLLERGADVNRVFMYQGRLPFSALDAARQSGIPALAELLETYGAKSGAEILAAQPTEEQ